MSLFQPDAEIVFSSRREAPKPEERVAPSEKRKSVFESGVMGAMDSRLKAKSALNAFAAEFEGKVLQDYQYARQMAAMASNNRDSIHYLKTINNQLIKSLEETFPLINFAELRDSMAKSEALLTDAIFQENVPNTKFIPALVGITETLI